MTTKWEFQELARLMEHSENKKEIKMDFPNKRELIIEALKIAAQHSSGEGLLK